jgi:DNA ligase (NAD+)
MQSTSHHAQKSIIRDQVEKLRESINAHSHNYFILDQPEISDAHYDEMFNHLVDLEKSLGDPIPADSPTQRVGYTPNADETGLKTVIHEIPMQSLSNAFNHEDTASFMKSTSRSKETVYIAEPKLDGLAIQLRYEKGTLVRAVTRGDQLQGEDVTPQCRTIKSIPLRINMKNPPDVLEVRGEVFMPFNSFNEFNQLAHENNTKPIKNPRNGASGAVRQSDPRKTAARKLDFIPYGRGVCTPQMSIKTHYDLLTFFSDIGFKINKDTCIIQSHDEFVEYYDRMLDARTSLAMDIDGLVLKVNNFEEQEAIGYNSREPKWAIARKFPAAGKETRLLDVAFTVGRSQIITPVGIIDPIDVGGVTINRATLFNMNHIAKIGVQKNDTILVSRAGDVIPYIVSSIKSHDSSISISIPESCPECQSPIIKIENAHYCSNSDGCAGSLVESIIHFSSRKVMNIKGLGDKTIAGLCEKKYIKSPLDLYSITKEQILNLPGHGDLKSSNILDAISLSKSTDLYRFIAGLDIKHVGISTSKILANHFKTLDAISAASLEEIKSLSDIGPITALSIYDYFKTKQDYIKAMINVGIHWPAIEEQQAQTGDLPLSGITITITGTLTRHKREELKEILTKMGAVINDSLKKDTAWLVFGENAGSKLNKAKKSGIRLVDEQEIYKIIGDREQKF